MRRMLQKCCLRGTAWITNSRRAPLSIGALIDFIVFSKACRANPWVRFASRPAWMFVGGMSQYGTGAHEARPPRATPKHYQIGAFLCKDLEQLPKGSCAGGVRLGAAQPFNVLQLCLFGFAILGRGSRRHKPADILQCGTLAIAPQQNLVDPW